MKSDGATPLQKRVGASDDFLTCWSIKNFGKKSKVMESFNNKRCRRRKLCQSNHSISKRHQIIMLAAGVTSAFIDSHPKRRRSPSSTISSTLFTFLILLLTSSTHIQIATATQIQGFIYWDVNSNGLLDTPSNNDNGGDATTNNGGGGSSGSSSGSSGELSNGVVDATVQLHRCTPFSSGEQQHSSESFADNKSAISTTISTWHPFNMGQKFEGHNEIYPNGGYYSLDVTGDDNNDGSSSGGGRSDCLLTDADLLQLENGGQGSGSGSAANTNERYIGCYLVISSPTNYQITSSFPLRHSNFHERFLSSSSSTTATADASSDKYIVEDNDNSIFDWVPYYDVINTTSYSTTSTSTSIINHGYHARTSDCFGYHPVKRTWYKYTPIDSSTTSSSSTTTSSSSSTTTITTSTNLIKLTTPNANQYNYNSIIYPATQQPNYDVYDTTLSMTPLGMSESSWPLDLRVSTDVSVVDSTAEVNSSNRNEGTRTSSSNNGGLIMGLTLDIDRNSGEYVLLSDSGTLSEKGRDDGGGEGSSNGGGEARFEFVPMGSSTDAVSALDYYMEKREGEREKEILMKEEEENGGVESGGAITVSIGSGSDTDYEHDNINGILENPQIMIDVIQSFLMERENLKMLQEGLLELTGLTVVLLNQWSLVTVVDKASPQSEQQQGGEKKETTSTRMLAKAYLRGSSSSYGRVVDSYMSSNSPNHLLRGSHESHPVSTSNRRMIALRNPHLVYQFAVYAKYREKDGPDQDEIARQLSTNFGTLVTKMCNIRRENLIARIRGRSGYYQGCNPKSTTNNNGSGGDGTVTYTAFGSSEKDYVEIDIGVVNRFDCDKLLPLYYYELESLAVRAIIDDSGGSLSGQDDVLSTALQLLQVDDGHYTVKEAPNTGNGATTTIVIAVSVVVGVLFVAAVGAVWYVRKERRKLRLERERRRKARDLKFAARQARKERRQRRSIRKEERRRKEKTEDEEELIPANVDEDAGSLGDDEIEKLAEEEEMNSRRGGIAADNYELKDKDEVKDAPDDQSDVDSELERLFEGSETNLQAVDEDEVQPVEKSRRRSKKLAGSESETDSKMTDHSASFERLFNKSERSGSDIHPHDQSNTSLRKHQRRKKKADGGSESGSKTSRDEHQSTDKTPPTRSHSSQQGSNPASAKAEADDDSDPPTRIDLSERGKLQKGISDISIGLAASLKKSFTKVAGTLNDLQEDEDSEKEDDRKTRRRRKKRVVRSSNDESAEPSHIDKKKEGTRRRRRTLTKVMSSFRGSSNAIDVDEEKVEGDKKAGEEGTQRRRSRRSGMGTVMSSFRRASADGSTGTPRKRMTRTMSSMRMSVRNVLIGELSSSSDDDSSSDSSSDSDSSSSSSDDSAVVKRKRTATRPVTRKTSKESKSKKNTSQEIGTRAHKKSSKKPHDQKQATSKDDDGTCAAVATPESPSKNDDRSCAAVAALESPSKNDGASCAAVATHKPQRKDDDESCAAVAMPKPRPERSLGRGTKSNKSDDDNNTCAAIAVQRPPSERSTKSNTDTHRTDSKKRSKKVSKDGERKKKDKSSHDHTSSKKSHRKKSHKDKDETEREPKRRTSRRELVENLRSSLKTSLSSQRMGSLKGKQMSDLAQAALEDEGAHETSANDSSKRKSKHSSKKKSSHKHHHRRLDGSERSDRSTSERNGEKPKRKKSSRRHSDHDTSERGSDRESNRGTRKDGTHHKSSSHHRDKKKSSSSKHRERKRREAS